MGKAKALPMIGFFILLASFSLMKQMNLLGFDKCTFQLTDPKR
jgi:hypothetical protein